MNKLDLFIDGEFVPSRAGGIEVTNPATQEVLCEVPFATAGEVDRAVQGAKETFRAWREVPTPERARLLFAYQALLKKHQDDVARDLCKDTARPGRMRGARCGGGSRWSSTPAASLR